MACMIWVLYLYIDVAAIRNSFIPENDTNELSLLSNEKVGLQANAAISAASVNSSEPRKFDITAIDLARLDDLVARYGANVSIFYKNIESGLTFTHNADQDYFGASLMKAPFAFWLYQKADSGLIDLESTLNFNYSNKLMGSGIIRHNYLSGTDFTLRRLIGLNLYESDNTATQMLHQAFGYYDFLRFVENLGGLTSFWGYALDSRATANQMGTIMKAIFEYLESGNIFSNEFRQNLLNNQFPFIISDYPVASKTGWYDRFGGAWHDMSIVYAPSPYILVILSSEKSGTADDHQVYQNISLGFQEFNRINFDR